MTDSAILERFKANNRIEYSTNSMDAEILELVATAKAHILNKINRLETEIVVQGEWPKPLMQAVIMLASSWYEQPTHTTDKQLYEVPDSVTALIKPYTAL